MSRAEIIDCIKHLPDEKDYVVVIFIDLKTVFEMVDHEVRLSKLDHYSIRGHVNMLFRSYLTIKCQ